MDKTHTGKYCMLYPFEQFQHGCPLGMRLIDSTIMLLRCYFYILNKILHIKLLGNGILDSFLDSVTPELLGSTENFWSEMKLGALQVQMRGSHRN